MTEPTYRPIDECKTVVDLLSDPARWLKHRFARNGAGGAVSWCLYGAISFIYRGDYDLEVEACTRLKEVVGSARDIVLWNDDVSRTHAEVMEAAAKAKI